MQRRHPTICAHNIHCFLWLGVLVIELKLICGLVYPANSLLQLTASISIPVMDLPPQRRIGFDWGFQMNYDMPFNVSSFYNVPIWPGKSRLMKRASEAESQRFPKLNYELLDIYQHFMATFQNFGFHKSCLLLCICELLQQPFQSTDIEFFEEIFDFFGGLSSFFNATNQDFVNLPDFNLAQARGQSQSERCAKFYKNCKLSPLNLISKIVIE